jgi:hypothetical protein
VTWSLTDGRNLYRTESITASKELKIRRIWMTVPTKANHIVTDLTDRARTDHLISAQATLDVRVLNSDWPLRISAFATGDDPLGRGDRGPIPLHLILETSHELTFAPGAAHRWEIELTSILE